MKRVNAVATGTKHIATNATKRMSCAGSILERKYMLPAPLAVYPVMPWSHPERKLNGLVKIVPRLARVSAVA